ncbi:nucleotide-binding universal stress UspA family protein [Winogradskyella pacifica]|uniref:Nucleotide-binding universal stress UspA family protein n=1 Tax=Winogradskyella pacifica TaxID=664642 RepID=A0A3D9N7W5_9FLAO|nr:universal stress protein [Winogradskyella pacifica]REE27536.1 nucleotide-binding universal stress UspA family protein [Winogradskyella pacifica]
MPKHILLPTDFSDNALSAAIYTLKLYKEEQCTFHFLHSSKLHTSSMSSMSNKLARVLAEKARKELDELKAKVERDYANEKHTFEVILSTNDLHSLIEVVVEKENIDLIVIGTKGETKAKEILFGSNTVNIIKQVKNCPILVIPNKYDFVKPEQIAFPTDFNRIYGDELLPLKQLADLNSSKIRIVHINNEDDISESQKQNLALLEMSLEHYDYGFNWMPNYDRKAKAIQDFIEDFKINILVMVNYKHSFIENIIKEPIITNISFHPTVPFLVIPQN